MSTATAIAPQEKKRVVTTTGIESFIEETDIRGHFLVTKMPADPVKGQPHIQMAKIFDLSSGKAIQITSLQELGVNMRLRYVATKHIKPSEQLNDGRVGYVS